MQVSLNKWPIFVFTTSSILICPTIFKYLTNQLFRSSYILKQDSLPSSYRSFLNKHGGKDLVLLQGLKDIACGRPFSNLGAIKKYYKSLGVDVKLDPNMKIPCSVSVSSVWEKIRSLKESKIIKRKVLQKYTSSFCWRYLFLLIVLIWLFFYTDNTW